jgi:2-desacetyl-2-hydroxyethyl bacteriochlorophyllide A dehydrogenase
MLAGIYRGFRQIRLEDYQLRKLQTNELLIEVGSCGICGTDFHIVDGTAPSKQPVILGHEFSGRIVEKDNQANGFNIDDRVVINPNIHCGFCDYCKIGKVNHCKNLRALGVSENGGLAQYSIVPASQAYLVPNDFSLQTAAFAEPLSCCIHGINKSSLKLRDKIAIVGAGTIGLLMLQLALLHGSSEVMIIEPSPEKRKIAKELGADHVFDSNDADFVQEIIELSGGGVDVVFECVGKVVASETSLKIVKSGSTVLLFGLPDYSATISLNLQSFFHKEISIKSSLLNPFTFHTAVDLLVSGKISVEQFNSEQVSFRNEELVSLFNNSKNNSVVKYMITPNN